MLYLFPIKICNKIVTPTERRFCHLFANRFWGYIRLQEKNYPGNQINALNYLEFEHLLVSSVWNCDCLNAQDKNLNQSNKSIKLEKKKKKKKKLPTLRAIGLDLHVS